MKILSLRVARRALGVAVFQDDQFEVLDGRHLSSDRSLAEQTATSYLEQFLGNADMRGAVLLAPDERHTPPTSMLRVVQTILVRAGLSIRIVHCDEMFRAFGYPPLKNRAELQRVVGTLLPEAEVFKGAVRPYVIEAAALALYADVLFKLLSNAS
jgi:hypothetical protein